MVFEFSLGERLRQNFCILIFRKNVLKQHDLSLHTSLIWWYRISICLDLSWNTGLIESFMQLWLSQWITVGSKWEPNKPTKIFLIQIALHAAWLVAMYSASTEMSAIDLCFLLYQQTVVDLILKTPPYVLFLFDALPAQSTFVDPWKFTSSVCLYHKPYPDVPLMYLMTCLPACKRAW